MWIYFEDDLGGYRVGFYTPDGVFELESCHARSEAAAERVHYLNGGNPERKDNSLFNAFADITRKHASSLAKENKEEKSG